MRPSGPTSHPTSLPKKKLSINREPLGDFRYCSAFDGYCGFGHFKGFGDFGIIATPVVFGFAPESALLLSGLMLTMGRFSYGSAWESACYPGEASGEAHGGWLNRFSFPLLSFFGGCTLSPLSVVFP